MMITHVYMMMTRVLMSNKKLRISKRKLENLDVIPTFFNNNNKNKQINIACFTSISNIK